MTKTKSKFAVKINTGPDAAVFLRANLSKWIPSLRGRDIEIDRAHRVYDGGRGSDRPRTLFFVYGCRLFTFLCCFCFYSRHLYFYLFYIISKGIFHIGGLVSKMHISVYGLFTEWKCFCFLHLLCTILGL